MAAPVLVLKNIEHEGPGLFADVARERGFSLEIVDLNRGEEPGVVDDYSAVVVCGGPDSANDDTEKMKKELAFVREVIAAEKPYFGICLGLQVLAKAADCTIVPAHPKEIGFADPEGKQFTIELTQLGTRDPFFYGCESSLDVFQLHGETVDLNENVQLLGTGKWCPNQAIRVGKRAYGIQSHVELTREMFDQWLDLDPDIKRGDHAQLHQQFEGLYNDYERTAHLLFNNFLDIVDKSA